jgi:triosephosphate isomerase
MSRRPFVAGNWKMHKTASQARPFVTGLRDRLTDGVDVAVCVPFTALAESVHAASGSPVAVFAQNMHEAESGAFTGEISAPMLLDAGVDGVLLGHSERRALFNETDAALARKLVSAHAAGLRVIFAVGETGEQRDAGETESVLAAQLSALAGLTPAQVARTAIAYEPVWAIGTGRSATPEMAAAAHEFVRGWVERRFGVGAELRIQYGGSVNPANAAVLFSRDGIDGGLIGGASLELDSFAAILAAAGP